MPSLATRCRFDGAIVRLKMLSFSILLSAAGTTLVNAAGTSDSLGQFHAAIAPCTDCPAVLVSAVVHDPERRPAGAVAFTGPISTSGVVTYNAKIQAKTPGIVAFEIEWTALNGMDEPLASRRIVYAVKKPIAAGKEKREYLQSNRLADDAAKYSAALVRVKFEDGSVWPAAAE